MKKEVMICDRCGKMYEVGQEAMVPSGSDGRGIKTLYDVVITYRARTNSKGKYYYDNNKLVCGEELDLCPACANLFFNWLLLIEPIKTEVGTYYDTNPNPTLYLDDIGTGTKVIQPELTISRNGENNDQF